MDGSESDAKNRHMVLDHSKLFKKVPNVVQKIFKKFKFQILVENPKTPKRCLPILVPLSAQMRTWGVKLRMRCAGELGIT